MGRHLFNGKNVLNDIQGENILYMSIANILKSTGVFVFAATLNFFSRFICFDAICKIFCSLARLQVAKCVGFQKDIFGHT